MALWDTSGIATIKQASLFNQLFSRKLENVISTATPTLQVIMGKSMGTNDVNMATPNVPVSGFERSDRITGNQVEVRMQGKLRTISTVADGSAEVATASLSYDSAIMGASVFSLAHYADTLPVPASDYFMIRGDDAKTVNFIADMVEYWVSSLADTIATAVCAETNAPSRSYFGSLLYGIDDANTYGGLVRTSNTIVQSTVRDVTSTNGGVLDFSELNLARVATQGKGGKVELLVCPLAQFVKLGDLIAGQTIAINDSADTTMSFGAAGLKFAGMWAVYDPHAASGIVLGVDPRQWRLYLSIDNAAASGIIQDPHAVASWVLPVNVFGSLITKNPARAGFKLKNILN